MTDPKKETVEETILRVLRRGEHSMQDLAVSVKAVHKQTSLRPIQYKVSALVSAGQVRRNGPRNHYTYELANG